MNREQADEVVQRTATLAILYYPEIHADEPGFTIATDIAWALEGAGELGEAADAVRDAIARTIIDPTLHRESLTELVYGLVPGEGDD